MDLTLAQTFLEIVQTRSFLRAAEQLHVTPTSVSARVRTLEELLDSLDTNLFWQAHRSYLENINRIREVVPWFKSSYQLRMDDKKQTEIPVSRAQTKRLRELFGL